jgi:hypothetical protein
MYTPVSPTPIGYYTPQTPNYIYTNGGTPVYPNYSHQPQLAQQSQYYITANQQHHHQQQQTPPSHHSQQFQQNIQNQHLQQQQTLRLPIMSPSTPVKIEPQEQQWQPYFTNPIPFKQEFKQEPSESASATTSRQNSSNKNSDNDAAALNIVSHLLKDQQILNQLEKVAQSFRLN